MVVELSKEKRNSRGNGMQDEDVGEVLDEDRRELGAIDSEGGQVELVS